jgi:predicted CXXCH cytochrome family protein
MKKYIALSLAIGLLLAMGTVALAGTAPGTGIKNTSHDLSVLGGNAANFYTDDATKDRICVYCHAPHNTLKSADADPAFDYLPLWNHKTTTNVGAYTMYTNGSYQPGLIDHQFNGIDSMGQPGGVSLLCLSCHDGSVGVNEYGFYNQSSKNAGAAKAMTGRALIGSGGDLSNHHPIGFNYDDVAGLDQEIRLSTVSLPTGSGGVLPGGPVYISDLLATGGNMECVTCHDVHNTKNGGTKFTWVDDTNSRFCFTCHVKDGSTQNQPGL